MFGNMMGDMEARQEEMQKKLATIIVEAAAGDGAIKVTANATREILNIAIDKEKIDLTDTEELEDLMLVAMNRVIEMATAQEQMETQKMIQEIMPPDLGGLGNLFGGN